MDRQDSEAWLPVDDLITQQAALTIGFELYCGDGTGADGMCMNLGANSLGGGNGEDGVLEGVAVCFDEWSNGGDHGIFIFYDGAPVFEDFGTCDNREHCPPVSLFEDSQWHDIEVTITPSCSGGDCSASIAMEFDSGTYSARGEVASYVLPDTTYLGFTARTGGATNNHWVRSIYIGSSGDGIRCLSSDDRIPSPSEAGAILAEAGADVLGGWGPPALLSAGRPTTQSSVAYGGVPERAVDGNTDGHYERSTTCTHTSHGGNKWWQVDLGSSSTVGRVDVYHRTNCCTDRAVGGRVIISTCLLYTSDAADE